MWNPLTSPVDYVVLAGQRSPGLATLDGWGSPRQWDERRGYGVTGATVVYKGTKLARGRLSIRLITEADWEAWEAWRPLVQRPPSDQRPRALDIQHPVLEGLGIRSVVVEDVSQPAPTGDTGEYTIEIKLLEFREPQRAVVRPRGSQNRPQPVDPVDRYIEQLTAQVQELAG